MYFDYFEPHKEIDVGVLRHERKRNGICNLCHTFKFQQYSTYNKIKLTENA